MKIKDFLEENKGKNFIKFYYRSRKWNNKKSNNRRNEI